MRRRRGPGLLMTTAVVGTTAYVASSSASKKAAQQQASAQQQAATQQQMADMQANQEALAQQQAMLAQQQAAGQPAAGPASNSFDEQLVQIQKLSAMKDQGLITEEEFNAKKAQILGIYQVTKPKKSLRRKKPISWRVSLRQHFVIV